MLAEVGEERERALASYGLNLGICFQMVDDLLDFTADEKVLGKPAANDLREGKVTLPVIFLLRRAGRAGLEMVTRVLADRGFDRVSREELVALAREHGALDEARALAERYAAQARQDLGVFERSPTATRCKRCPTSSWPATTEGATRPRDVRSPTRRPEPRRGAERIDELRAEIRRHERLYYVPAAPEIGDEEYDRLDARAARPRGAAPRAGHARQPHAAGGRSSPRTPSPVRPPRAHAQPGQHLQRGGAARVRGAHLPRRSASARWSTWPS